MGDYECDLLALLVSCCSKDCSLDYRLAVGIVLALERSAICILCASLEAQWLTMRKHNLIVFSDHVIKAIWFSYDDPFSCWKRVASLCDASAARAQVT